MCGFVLVAGYLACYYSGLFQFSYSLFQLCCVDCVAGCGSVRFVYSVDGWKSGSSCFLYGVDELLVLAGEFSVGVGVGCGLFFEFEEVEGG